MDLIERTRVLIVERGLVLARADIKGKRAVNSYNCVNRLLGSLTW